MILGINIEWWILYVLIIFCWAFLTARLESRTTYMVRRVAPELIDMNVSLRRCEKSLARIAQALEEDGDDTGKETADMRIRRE
ncbi:MAG: hypothetical protein P8175_09685 [Deltaproteobacteria bacterium]|jgi:hypothetical protein